MSTFNGSSLNPQEMVRRYWPLLVPAALGLLLLGAGLTWWVSEMWTRSIGAGSAEWSAKLPPVPPQRPNP